MQKYSSDFIRLLECLYRVRETIIWLPLNAEDTEESLFLEICNYIEDYKKTKGVK